MKLPFIARLRIAMWICPEVFRMGNVTINGHFYRGVITEEELKYVLPMGILIETDTPGIIKLALQTVPQPPR